MGFLPLSRRDKESSAEYEQLAEGVPEWLAQSLYDWVSAVESALENVLEHGQVIARLLRLRIDAQYVSPVAVFWSKTTADNRLDIIDALLRGIGSNYVRFGDPFDYHTTKSASERLETILSSGGSAWRVSDYEPHELVKRVDPTLTRLARNVIEHGSDGAKAIATAWSKCYGRHPNYDDAYRNLVLAVESAIHPLVTPTDLSATLGKAKAHIAQTNDNWTIAGMTNSADALLGLLNLIWGNQERHAQADGTIRGVGKTEAEVALSAALTVIQWVRAGAITKTA